MAELAHEFLEYVLKREALRFGSFQTKSGRTSPYFFNAGGLFLGSDLLELSRFYASAMHQNFGEGFDIVFGPAYKGIPLSVITTMGLKQHHQREVAYCYNRKEAKDHGEKGSLVGKVPVAGDRVVIVDDVITAGTAIRETMDFLKGIEGLEVVGVLVALDRQEKGSGDKSAIMEVEDDFGIPVKSIANLATLLEWTQSKQQFDPELIQKIMAYRDQYGV